MTVYKRPDQNEYPPYFDRYIQLVPDGEIISQLNDSLQESLKFYKSIPIEKWDFAYAPLKWTIGTVLTHTIDTERIMAYRALCCARGESESLLGFDENEYAEQSKVIDRSPTDIIEEYQAVRNANIQLFKSMNDQNWYRIGQSSNRPFTAYALSFIIIGHEIHHRRVIEERYL